MNKIYYSKLIKDNINEKWKTYKNCCNFISAIFVAILCVYGTWGFILGLFLYSPYFEKYNKINVTIESYYPGTCTYNNFNLIAKYDNKFCTINREKCYELDYLQNNYPIYKQLKVYQFSNNNCMFVKLVDENLKISIFIIVTSIISFILSFILAYFIDEYFKKDKLFDVSSETQIEMV